MRKNVWKSFLICTMLLVFSGITQKVNAQTTSDTKYSVYVENVSSRPYSFYVKELTPEVPHIPGYIPGVIIYEATVPAVQYLPSIGLYIPGVWSSPTSGKYTKSGTTVRLELKENGRYYDLFIPGTSNYLLHYNIRDGVISATIRPV